MPCRVPKRRFSCGAPQHLTKNPNKHIPSRCPARADGHGIDGRLTGRRHVADPSSKPNEADDGTNGHRSLRQGLQDRKGHGTDHSRRNDIR